MNKSKKRQVAATAIRHGKPNWTDSEGRPPEGLRPGMAEFKRSSRSGEHTKKTSPKKKFLQWNSIKYKENADRAIERSNIYGLLAVIFYEEPSKALIEQIKNPEFLETLSNLEIRLEDDFFLLSKEKLMNELSKEYTKLFLGPGKHIPPYESVHLKGKGEGQLWGESTARVKKIIESSGLQYNSGFNGMPDHISVELEFMQKVTQREADAWKEEDKNGALFCLKIEKMFLEDHLGKWAPTFCSEIIKKAELSFYKEIAKLTKSFITMQVQGYKAEKKL